MSPLHAEQVAPVNEGGRRLMCDDRYTEWENPQAVPGEHYLNLFSKSGFFEGAAKNAPVQKIDGKTKLFVCLNVYQLDKVDAGQSQFSGSFRLYLLWQIDFEDPEYSWLKQNFESKAVQATDDYYSMSSVEVKSFMENMEDVLPSITLFNAISAVKVPDSTGIRLYYGPNGERLNLCCILT